MMIFNPLEIVIKLEAMAKTQDAILTFNGTVIKVKWRPLDRYSYWLGDVDYSRRQFLKLLTLMEVSL